MSIYAQAVMSGMGALEVLATGGNAQTRAAYDESYNETYSAVASRHAAGRAKVAAEKNISGIKQDRILTNTMLGMKQAEAEASARVSAAASGVTGGSVDQVIYETHKNESHRVAENMRQSEQAIESEKSKVDSSQRALLSVNPVYGEVSYVGDLLSAFSSFELGDLEIAEALANRGE
tara:strand:- start:5021 stop:5551 length:531 start_codon:yes stop_codon:yes gene_type:complete